MSLTQILDHAERAISRVITRLRGTEFEALLRVFASEVQEAEDALYSLVTVLRDPSLAEGDCLDRLGRFVGAEVRGTHNDAEYRLRVAAAIARNRASGAPEDLISVVLAFFPSQNGNLAFRDADVEGTGCATLKPKDIGDGSGYQPVSPAQAEELMRYLSRAAGVRVIFSYSPVLNYGAPDVNAARFDDAFGGFDGDEQFSGSVDQKTRN